jgi:hypothetical protein
LRAQRRNIVDKKNNAQKSDFLGILGTFFPEPYLAIKAAGQKNWAINISHTYIGMWMSLKEACAAFKIANGTCP